LLVQTDREGLPTASGKRRLSYWERRALRHVTIAISGALVGWLIGAQAHHRSTAEALSFSTAYAGLMLLVAGLAVGPINLLRRRPNPVSTDLRRDIGIWAGIYGIAHTVAGLQVHMGGHMLRYFVAAPGFVPAGTKAFIAANWLGLVGALLFLVLVTISNDVALRMLGTARWKLLQRSTYVVIAVVVAHGAVYQLLEKRVRILVIVFAVLAIVVVSLQTAGIRTMASRRRDALRR
jgi:methionine sulfoxide reductase heme-binding subunit